MVLILVPICFNFVTFTSLINCDSILCHTKPCNLRSKKESSFVSLIFRFLWNLKWQQCNRNHRRVTKSNMILKSPVLPIILWSFNEIVIWVFIHHLTPGSKGLHQVIIDEKLIDSSWECFVYIAILRRWIVWVLPFSHMRRPSYILVIEKYGERRCLYASGKWDELKRRTALIPGIKRSRQHQQLPLRTSLQLIKIFKLNNLNKISWA